jgi:hypothetical protein
MRDTMRPVRGSAPEAADDGANPFRDRIAERSAELDATYPRAVELEARVLRALHDAIHGSATLLRGLHSPQRFRDALMGLKNFPLADLCRLATEPTREARGAVHAVLQELAGAIGYRLEPIDAKGDDAHAALAGLMLTSTGFAAKGVTALSDGKIEAHEARDLRPALEEVKRGVARFEGILSRAEKTGDAE